MRPVLVDADILLDFLAGRPEAVDFMETFERRILLSAIVVAEVCARARNEAEEAFLEDFLSLFPVIPLSESAARAAARQSRLHRVSLADAILAATAEAEGAELKTLHTRHYPMFEGLEPAYTKK